MNSDLHRQKRTTIADVARAAGVSKTTVSYVLSDRAGVRVPLETRRRIVDAAARVGYHRNALAVAFRSGRMNTVGIVAPFSLMSEAHTPGSVYYKDLLLALAAAGMAAGMNAILLSEDNTRELSLSDLTDRRADGVILVVKANADDFVRAAEEAGVPCVTVGREVGAWQVHADNARGAHLAVEHLLDLGHRKIAFLWHGKAFVPSARQRRDAFREATRAAGLPFEDAPEFVDRDMNVVSHAFRSPHRPTAVFCYNDELAVRMIDAARQAGLSVPADVSLVGFDNNILAHIARPSLTTIHNPLQNIATAAVQLIRQQMNGAPPPGAPVLVPPHLVIRDSTAALSRKGEDNA